MSRYAGSKKVYFASSSPPVRHPNVYGIDMPVPDELVAAGRSIEEVQELIGADWLVYQDLHDLEDAVRFRDREPHLFDTSCFSGNYVTGAVTPEYLARLREQRSDHAKTEREGQRKRKAS